MSHSLFVGAILPALFAGILVFLEIGRRLRLTQLKKAPAGGGAGMEVVEGAIFGLMALLIAFTFSGAASRFETRRHLVVEEANCIGTAYLRLDLLPEAHQPALREKFRRYTDTRLEMYKVIPDIEATRAAFDRSVRLQGEIWEDALAATTDASNTSVRMLLLPALNAMFDISTTRFMAVQFHTPALILLLLICLTWACALLAGFRMSGDASRKWIHMVIFAALMSLTIYVIIDFEFPRVGLISLETYDEALVSVRASMQ